MSKMENTFAWSRMSDKELDDILKPYAKISYVNQEDNKLKQLISSEDKKLEEKINLTITSGDEKSLNDAKQYTDEVVSNLNLDDLENVAYVNKENIFLEKQNFNKGIDLGNGVTETSIEDGISYKKAKGITIFDLNDNPYFLISKNGIHLYNQEVTGVKKPEKDDEIVNKKYVDDLLIKKQNKLSAGAGISISGDTISTISSDLKKWEITGAETKVVDLGDNLKLLIFQTTRNSNQDFYSVLPSEIKNMYNLKYIESFNYQLVESGGGNTIYSDYNANLSCGIYEGRLYIKAINNLPSQITFVRFKVIVRV